MAGQRRTSGIDVDSRAFEAGLRKALQDLKINTEGGLVAFATGTINRAKELCPVDTGALRSSLGFEQGRDSRSVFVDIYARREYAPYVEFGTSRAHAQPYLRPALAEAARDFGTGAFYAKRQLRATG